MFSGNKGKIKTKLSSNKKEFAPIGFYFDLFSNSLFTIPILPIPMRVDKVTNGEPTCLITLDIDKLKEVSESLDLFIDFKSFYTYGIKNLINYARETYKSITYRKLKKDALINWYNNSISTQIEIPSLTNDFTFIITSFLETYSNFKSSDFLQDKEFTSNELIKYCEKILTHFRRAMNRNSIHVVINGEIKEEKIYSIKKQKYYPLSVNIDIWDEKNQNSKKGKFIPYLIYDDIIDVFFYNYKLLVNNEKELINLELFEELKILVKNKNLEYYSSYKQIQDVNLSEMLKDW